jgi:hypothetical protein
MSSKLGCKITAIGETITPRPDLLLITKFASTTETASDTPHMDGEDAAFDRTDNETATSPVLDQGSKENCSYPSTM